MRKIILIITVFLVWINAVSAQDCTELFFSEYLEGSGNNKGLEIYNPTDGIINLGSYWIARYSNGQNTFEAGGLTHLEGFIQPYSTHLIVNGQTEDSDISPASDPNLRAIAQQLDGDYPSPTYMNGNDAIALFKDNGGSGNFADFELVDLFGIIGGGMPADGEGWASVTDQWIYKNVWDNDGNVIGQDSAFVTNYIIPDGYYFIWWWLWTKYHTLVRKPHIKHGVTAANMPTDYFNVTLEWDTVPSWDTISKTRNKDVWDSLNAHFCYCQYPSEIEAMEVIEKLTIYPNPAVENIIVSANEAYYEINIYDLSGKLVLHSIDRYGIKSEEYNIGCLPDGIYMLKIKTRNSMLSKKLIKR